MNITNQINQQSRLTIIPPSFQITLHISLLLFFIAAILLFIIWIFKCQGHHLFLNTPRMITEHSCTSKICSLCTGQLLIISWRSSPHRPHPLVHCPAAHLEPKDSKNIRNVSDQISDMKQQQICAKGNSLRFLYCGNLLFYPARSWTISDDRNTKQVWKRVKFWCSIWHMKQHSCPQNPQDNLRDPLPHLGLPHFYSRQDHHCRTLLPF